LQADAAAATTKLQVENAARAAQLAKVPGLT
jgi:hypothetical protein